MRRDYHQMRRDIRDLRAKEEREKVCSEEALDVLEKIHDLRRVDPHIRTELYFANNRRG